MYFILAKHFFSGNIGPTHANKKVIRVFFTFEKDQILKSSFWVNQISSDCDLLLEVFQIQTQATKNIDKEKDNI